MSRRLLAGIWIAVLVAQLGAAEPLPRGYGFAQAPLSFADRLAESKLLPSTVISSDDRQFLEQLWQARLAGKPVTPEQVETAFWIASGVAPADRADYQAKFETLVKDAKAATESAKTTSDRGEQLMKFLHGRVMKNGYSADVTTLHEIFDTGKYNCVSSSAIYYLVGTRLGLTLEPLLIEGGFFQAGHAALTMIDGKSRVEVEPTNPEGFDIEAKLRRPNVVRSANAPDRSKGVASDALGLAASMVSNRGQAVSKTDPAQAIQLDLIAVTLDPTGKQPVQNFRASLVNWGLGVSKQGDYDLAVRIYGLAAKVDPENRDVRNNHSVIWCRYIEAELNAGRDESALKVIQRAQEALPNDRDFRDPAEWFTRAAHNAKGTGGWEAAFAVVERGRKILPAKNHEELQKYEISLYRRWSQDHLDRGEVIGSWKVLQRGLTKYPRDKELMSGVYYHTQKGLRIAGKSKPGSDLDHFEEVRQTFPQDKDLIEIGEHYAWDRIDKLLDEGKYADAVQELELVAAFAPETGELSARLYDRWARELAKKGLWTEAWEKYGEGLEYTPRDTMLINNAIVLVDDWAHPAIKAKKWSEAIAVYDRALKRFPDSGHLKHNRSYCESMAQK